MEKSHIEKVLLFDDNEIEDQEKYVSYIKKIMNRSFSKAKTLSGFVLNDNFSVESYFLNEEHTSGFVCTLEGREEYDWYNHLDSIIEEGKGYLILCDYGWLKGEFESERDKIFEHIKGNKNVIFVCYTATFQNATIWLNKIIKEQHECKIMDILVTVDKKIDGRTRSIEEAIEDEW